MKNTHTPTPLENLFIEMRDKFQDGIGADPHELKRWMPIIFRVVNSHEALLEVTKELRIVAEAINRGKVCRDLDEVFLRTDKIIAQAEAYESSNQKK